MDTNVRIGGDDAGRRLDRVLRKYLPEVPLSALHRMMRKGAILLDGKKAKADTRVAEGSILRIPASDGTAISVESRKAGQSEGPGEPFSILYEDSSFLVVNKEAGVLTHGEGSLDEAVADYLKGTLPPSLSFKPGPLHRLDRGTSGLIVFSKSLSGARAFSEALAARRLEKRYVAILQGRLAAPEFWVDEMERDTSARKTGIAENGGGLRAETRVIALASAGTETLVLVSIGTGRTHQIRAQAAAHGYPLLGDGKYGGRHLAGGFMLHSYELAPKEGNAEGLPPPLTAPPPARFLEFAAARFGAGIAEALARGDSTKKLADAVR